MLKSNDSKKDKDELYISLNITLFKYEDENIAKNIRTLFTNI